MVKPIVLLGDELNKQSDLPTEYNDECVNLITDLMDTLNQTTGCGLAAPQIGDKHRVFIVKYPLRVGEFKEAFINPRIIGSYGTQLNSEGCLSIPGIFEKVPRFNIIKVHYIDRNGIECEREFEGMISNIIQHELDHLDGITFVDKLPKVRLKKLRHKLEDIKSGNIKTNYQSIIYK